MTWPRVEPEFGYCWEVGPTDYDLEWVGPDQACLRPAEFREVVRGQVGYYCEIHAADGARRIDPAMFEP